MTEGGVVLGLVVKPLKYGFSVLPSPQHQGLLRLLRPLLMQKSRLHFEPSAP